MGSLLMNHELYRFLQAHQVTGKKDVTLTGMGDSNSLKGRWSIPDSDYKKFLDLLHDYLWTKEGVPINLIERPRKNESKPLVIDIVDQFSIFKGQFYKRKKFYKTNEFNLK